MKYIRYVLIMFICYIQFSCEDFVEVDVPDHKIVSETVFGSDETANSAVVGIYNELFNAEFSNGGFNSITLLSGLSADNIRNTYLNTEMVEFEANEILVQNSYNLTLWSSAYNIIYMCNAVIDGLQAYNGVSKEMEDKLRGEVQFIRAFVYFYLVNLYGEIPLIQNPDYQVNALASRMGIEEVYKAIITDLESASTSLEETYGEGERIRPNKFTAMALLARVHLYLEDWEKAELYSTEVINSTGNYALLDDLNGVFLTNSKEAIWQISPDNNGGGSINPLTDVGGMFIINIPPPNSQKPAALSAGFMKWFSKEDIRAQHWIGLFSADSLDYYYPFKYKANNSDETGEISEYSMVMRLAEQYLIRAEARAHQGKLPLAVDDLDKIRGRAQLPLISTTAPNIGREPLLDSLQVERQRELFTEWGHRWLDLKRTNKASEVLSDKKPSWQNTDVLYPIPEDEINKNPNLTQNNGY